MLFFSPLVHVALLPVALGLAVGNEDQEGADVHRTGDTTCIAVVVALYVYGYQNAPRPDTIPSLETAAAFIVEYLSLALCADSRQLWLVAGLAVVLFVALTILRLVAAWWQSPTERPARPGCC